MTDLASFQNRNIDCLPLDKAKYVGAVLSRLQVRNHSGKLGEISVSLQLGSGTVTSSQADPERSGWSNTIAAYFCLFFSLLLHIFFPLSPVTPCDAQPYEHTHAYNL